MQARFFPYSLLNCCSLVGRQSSCIMEGAPQIELLSNSFSRPLARCQAVASSTYPSKRITSNCSRMCRFLTKQVSIWLNDSTMAFNHQQTPNTHDFSPRWTRLWAPEFVQPWDTLVCEEDAGQNVQLNNALYLEQKLSRCWQRQRRSQIGWRIYRK